MQMWKFGLSVASVPCVTQMHECVFYRPRGLFLLASYGKRSLGHQICGVPIKKEKDHFTGSNTAQRGQILSYKTKQFIDCCYQEKERQDPGTDGGFLCSSLKRSAFLLIATGEPNDGGKS